MTIVPIPNGRQRPPSARFFRRECCVYRSTKRSFQCRIRQNPSQYSRRVYNLRQPACQLKWDRLGPDHRRPSGPNDSVAIPAQRRRSTREQKGEKPRVLTEDAPVEVVRQLSQAGLNHRPVLLSTSTDVALDGSPEQNWLVVSDERVSLVRNGRRNDVVLSLQEVDKFRACAGVGRPRLAGTIDRRAAGRFSAGTAPGGAGFGRVPRRVGAGRCLERSAGDVDRGRSDRRTPRPAGGATAAVGGLALRPTPGWLVDESSGRYVGRTSQSVPAPSSDLGCSGAITSSATTGHRPSRHGRP